jgi:hypothetical protein
MENLLEIGLMAKIIIIRILSMLFITISEKLKEKIHMQEVLVYLNQKDFF